MEASSESAAFWAILYQHHYGGGAFEEDSISRSRQRGFTVVIEACLPFRGLKSPDGRAWLPVFFCAREGPVEECRRTKRSSEGGLDVGTCLLIRSISAGDGLAVAIEL